MGRRLTLYFRSIDGNDFEMNVKENNSTGSRLLVGITEQHKSKTIRSVSSFGGAMIVTFRSSRGHSSSVDFVIMEGRNSFIGKGRAPVWLDNKICTARLCASLRMF